MRKPVDRSLTLLLLAGLGWAVPGLIVGEWVGDVAGTSLWSSRPATADSLGPEGIGSPSAPSAPGTAPADPRRTTSLGPGSARGPGERRPSSGRPRVVLLTFGPGDEWRSRFGHSALWIRSDGTGLGTVYSFGLSAPVGGGLVRQMVEGSVVSRVMRIDPRRMVESYARQGRSIHAQELRLDPSQARFLTARLEQRVGAGSGVYPYDFFRDNCTTGIRDALDRAMGGAVRLQTSGRAAEGTFRSEVHRFTVLDPVFHTALLLAMGRSVDEPISHWERMFLPVNLQETLRTVTTVDETGMEVPFVIAEETLRTASSPPIPARTSAGSSVYAAAGVAVGALLALLGPRPKPGRRRVSGGAPTDTRDRPHGIGRSPRWARTRDRAFVVLSLTWLGVVGGVGVVLSGLWVFTGQHLARHNENLLLVHPLALVAGFFIAAWAVGREWAGTAARRTAAGMVAVGLLALALKLTPGTHQGNAPIVGLVLPAHLGLWLGLWKGRGGMEREGTRARNTTSVGARPGFSTQERN